MRQGVFTTAYPDQVGEINLALLHGMENIHAQLLFSIDHQRDEQRLIDDIVTTHAAYMDAIEHVLGAPPNALDRTDAGAARVWVAAVRGNDHAEDSFAQSGRLQSTAVDDAQG